MNKILKAIIDVTVDAFHSFAYFIKINLINFANVISATFPLVAYFIGQYVSLSRNEINVGGELFLILAVPVVVFFIKGIANKLGAGYDVPVPEERFTKVNDDGEVTMEQRRIQELLLYMADLEDWMEKRGLL